VTIPVPEGASLKHLNRLQLKALATLHANGVLSQTDDFGYATVRALENAGLAKIHRTNKRLPSGLYDWTAEPVIDRPDL